VTLHTKALRARVERAFGDREVPRTDGGATSTSRRTLIKSGDPVLRQYAELGPSKKLLSTYVPILHEVARAGGRINHGLKALVRSGRTAAYKPNTQNPPRGGGFRECFVPTPGTAFVSVDYDIAELKGLGQILRWWFGSSALLDTINAGQDPHLAFAAKLLTIRWGRPVDYAFVKAVPKDKAHPLYDDVHGPKGARQLAKIANFGFPGGLGAAALVEYAAGYGVDLTQEEAAELRDAWFEWNVEISAYFDHIAAITAAGSATISSMLTDRQRGGVSFCAACNGYVG
jgi:DNA polymerase-1